jgi:DNA-directed RNA polymerase specialized sigma24 family protein
MMVLTRNILAPTWPKAFWDYGSSTRMLLPMGRDSKSTDSTQADASARFTAFVDTHGVRLRRVLTARYGVETGGDVHAEAMAWAWANWAKLEAMDNAPGYLYRVAQSSARPHNRWFKKMSFPANMPERWHLDSDSSLFESLRNLTEAQRIAVLLVHGHGDTYAEVAEVLGCSVAAVTNHVHRGLAQLRRQLEGEIDA